MSTVSSRYDFSRAQLAQLLADEPSYRVDQVWDGLYRQAAEPDELTALPKALRARLGGNLRPALTQEVESVADGGRTVKWLWRLDDGVAVETVLMHYRDRSTVCVSTQAGCAMACGFCATGQAGFDRHLTTGEIVEQVIRAMRAARRGPLRGAGRSERRKERSDDRSEPIGAARPRRVGNVVFMGMGEPLANYDRVWAAVERLHDDVGISARHLTLSTVGVVPGIRRLAGERLPVNLAVSLHAANDVLRDELVPLNRRYPLAALTDACRDYIEAKGRRLSLEWAMIAGVNDRDRDAGELASIARALGAHVNLIPLNPTPGYPVVGSDAARVKAFRDLLESLGVNATVRRNRGTSIDAACGQLRASAEVQLTRKA